MKKLVFYDRKYILGHGFQKVKKYKIKVLKRKQASNLYQEKAMMSNPKTPCRERKQVIRSHNSSKETKLRGCGSLTEHPPGSW